MKSIIFFTSDITLFGGIERVTINLANEFTEHCGLDVTILSNFKTKSTPVYPHSQKIKFEYLSNSAYAGNPGSFNRFKILIKNIKKVKKYFSKKSDYIIIAQAFPLAFQLWIAGIRRNNTLCVAEHVYYGYYNKIIRSLRHLIYKSFKRVIVLTTEDERYYLLHHLNVIRIPNGIVLPNYEGNIKREKTIISVGRLSSQKKFDILISVFYEIHKIQTDWQLKIYGDGELRNELEKQIDSLGLQKCAFLMGKTDNVNEVNQKAGIFVVSSSFEGFSIALVEAMANGVPCISFNCPYGPGDILTDGVDGFLVENQNKEKLAQKIEQLIEDSELRDKISLAGIESSKRYDISKIAIQWISLFKELE